LLEIVASNLMELRDSSPLPGTSASAEKPAPREPQRALVVDDDAAIRILISRILTRRGFTVDAVPDGAEAIEQLLQHDYAVITLDLMMPRIDGYGVIRYVTEHQPAMLERLIVITAFGTNAADGIAPPVRCIHKPFDIEELLAETAASSGQASE
jgi:two-component system response regulator PilR (NtrC family)